MEVFGVLVVLIVISLLMCNFNFVIKETLVNAIQSYYTQREFYKKKYYEVRGKVISFTEYTDSNGINDEIYYMLVVKTRKGKTYRIKTTNRKARKYIKKVYVTLLVPREDIYQIKDKENAVIIKEDTKITAGVVISIIFILTGFTVQIVHSLMADSK